MTADIREKIATLQTRMFSEPQFQTQGAVLFVDLERQSSQKAYLPKMVCENFLGGRGANMYLLYNLLNEEKEALDPLIPLIFGVGTLTGTVSCATRANVTSIAPDSYAILDASAGDYFPSFLKRHGYDHLVLYGKCQDWSFLKITKDQISFESAGPYVGMDNLEFTEKIEKDYKVKERKNLAMARITSAGENLVLSSGIMGGIKCIWARGGAGAKMGSMNLKAILLLGKPDNFEANDELKIENKAIRKKILSTSVITNALKKVGTPFLYKPSRIMNAVAAKNNQETTWFESLDADNFDPYRPGMDGCYKCPVRCRAKNDMTPEGKGGWGADALKGLKGNASYDPDQAEMQHQAERQYKGINEDNKFDQFDKGDGPEYVTLGKFGPNIGITSAEHVLRFNNILNNLGLDSASTGGAIGWAMELYQRGIIDKKDTHGLDLSWGNYEAVEKLLWQTARREGFGDVIADSSKAVERGKYPEEAVKYRMTVKGLFQSDPHDARILKAFALGLSVATRGFDHLRNRATLEINARINDDPEFKKALYNGEVSAAPNSYEGKEHAVRRCENYYAAGDAVGMCRFETKLFNSPSLLGPDNFSKLIKPLTELDMDLDQIEEAGLNIMGIERMINARLGLGPGDDTLPQRWFEEENRTGPFKGEKIDPEKFEELKQRFYKISRLDSNGVPQPQWKQELIQIITGFSVQIEFPRDFLNDGNTKMIIDEPVGNLQELWPVLKYRLPADLATKLDDHSLTFSLNGEVIMHGEKEVQLKTGDEVTLVPALAGG
ncbi:MAG: aldehyde ferredoxin oxidoreductase [Proteobacteria bacterium]|nr:aldehyde ferredoxin oxidoreductase [Pseudomonadota bacterium]